MNSDKTNRSRPLLLFYLLVGYVLVQFCWWSYLMFEQNKQIVQLKEQVISLQEQDRQLVKVKVQQLEAQLHKKWIMVAGEGSIFLFLLILGFIMIRKGFKKEAELARMQKNFLLSITHELKSPLSSARLQLETLLKHELSKEKQKEIIGSTIDDADRLNKMIEDLLFSARLDDKGWVLLKEKINVTAVLQKQLEKLKNRFSDRTFNIELEEGVHGEMDEQALQTICNNLVENAVKYSPQRSTISVRLSSENNKIVLTFIDEGYGVPNAEKENIFKRFYRVGNEDTRRTQGTGLGLYIVKNLVDRHQGKIEVRDNDPKGTVFVVVI